MRKSQTQIIPRLAIIAITVLIVAGIGFASKAAAQAEPAQSNSIFADAMLQTTDEPKMDHSTISALQGPFDKAQDVTRVCLACHSKVADEIMATAHWTWDYYNPNTEQHISKKTIINNFWTSIQSNEKFCSSCHIGYGYDNKDFDFTNPDNIDCLVCHDTTGVYQKATAQAGLPVNDSATLAEIAQSIGKTSIATCGSCHFYGGGSDGAKHGDLDSSLLEAPFALDVHMSQDGAGFTCTSCHETNNHNISGSRYSKNPEDWQGCEECHTLQPHELTSLNNHTARLACQTCHIPALARGGVSTVISWDWSQAGQTTNGGAPYIETDEKGNVIYDGRIGKITYGENLTPEYVWFNGQVDYYLAGQEFDPNYPVNINTFNGNIDDPTAKIWPVKVVRSIQPYDSRNNILAIPHLYGDDDAAYFINFDWQKSIQFGMDYAGIPFSGEYNFIGTEMTWAANHMVAPTEEALSCLDCHTDENSRLDFAGLGYSPQDVARLTNFPPATNFDGGTAASNTFPPEECETCHQMEYDLWNASTHNSVDVGCISCHQLEEEGEHPTVAFSMVKGAETCGACHIDSYRDWEQSMHSEFNVTCVTCHNPHSQQQMTIGDYDLSCETCHQENRDEISHSTHAAAGLTCISCHQNTKVDTGHTYEVHSDSCLNCHGATIHTANKMITGETIEPIEPEETEPEPSTNLNLPIWAGAFFAIVLGVGLTILFNNRYGGKEE